MSEVADRLKAFIDYGATLKGDEKGEAQVFLDRLFIGFGHAGYKEAGATLEDRIKKDGKKGTVFPDLVWKPRVLIEMKKRGEKLHLHYQQAFDYWLHAVPKRLDQNAEHGGCYQGQTHGHDGFLLEPTEAKALIKKEPQYSHVIWPFLIADDLIGEINSKPSRYVIDFHPRDQLEAQRFKTAYNRVKAKVLPDRQEAADEEEKRNRPLLKANPEAHVNVHHANFLKRWWLMSYPRADMIEAISKFKRYLVCGQVTKRPIFDFVSIKIRPNAALNVFAHDDDYSFGILQSGIHWLWFTERCSTLTERPRYTSNTVFDSFPWPQAPTGKAIRKVADAGNAFRKLRSDQRAKHNISFRDLYRVLDNPGDHPLMKTQEKLDEAVRCAYGMAASADPLTFLLDLNLKLAEKEAAGESIVGPGLPASVKDRKSFVTKDCVTP